MRKSVTLLISFLSRDILFVLQQKMKSIKKTTANRVIDDVKERAGESAKMCYQFNQNVQLF